jgi:hypothetical protein
MIGGHRSDDPMYERRAEPRTTRIQAGKARFQDISRDCTVLNLSRSGARLKFTGFTGLPEKFDLFIPETGTTYRAHIRWRFEDEIGVSLERAGAELDQNELLPRIEELEREVAELRLLLSVVLGRSKDAA